MKSAIPMFIILYLRRYDEFCINSFILLSFISLSNTVPNIAPIIKLLCRFHFAFVSRHYLHRPSKEKDLVMGGGESCVLCAYSVFKCAFVK